MTERQPTTVAEWLLQGRFTGLSCERRQGYERELAAIRTEIITCADIRASDVVLDMGCGTGFILQGMMGRGLDLIGLDQDAGVLAEARRILGTECRFVQAGVDEIPLPTGEVDVVVGRSVYVYAEALTHSVRELTRILAVGGRFSLFEPLDRRLVVADEAKVSGLSRELLSVARENGMYNRDFRTLLMSACADNGITVSTRSRPSQIELTTQGDIINRLFHVAPPGYAAGDLWQQQRVGQSDIDQCVNELATAAVQGWVQDEVVYGFFFGVKRA